MKSALLAFPTASTHVDRLVYDLYGFKPIEFDGFRKQAGLNSFVLTAKRGIEQTGAIGLVSKASRVIAMKKSTH